MIFNFAIDQTEITVLRRNYEVEADTIEEAKELMLQEFDSMTMEDDFPVKFIDAETVEESEELTPEQNSGSATKELYYRSQNGFEIFKNNATNPEEKL